MQRMANLEHERVLERLIAALGDGENHVIETSMPASRRHMPPVWSRMGFTPVSATARVNT